MPSRKLSDLVPEMQVKANEFAVAMHDAGIQFIFTQTKRTVLEQNAYFAQGRNSLEVVNNMRKAAGLPDISAKENSRIVTKTIKSRHLTGNAFDIAIVVNGKIIWNVNLDADGDGVPEYKEAALIGESVGLRAGFRFGDPPHFEI